MSNILVILGMHRSGTSLTAQWMHRCGISMGDDLMSPTDDNKQGHYEDMDFYKLHLDILRDNALHRSGLEGDLKILKISDSFRHKMKSLVLDKSKQKQNWGWKEPRTCLLISEYDVFLQQPFFLVVYRKAEEVIDSLLRRDLKVHRKRFKSQGLKGKIKILVFKWYLKEVISKLTTNFIDKYIYYNKYILDFIEKQEVDKYLVFDIKDISEIQMQLYSKLQKNGFQFKNIDTDTVIDNKLLSKKLKAFNKKNITPDQKTELIQINERFLKLQNNSIN